MTEVIKEDLYEVHTCVWQEIEIELKYWPLKWTVISHLEIRSVSPEKAPLPITEIKNGWIMLKHLGRGICFNKKRRLNIAVF